MIGMLSILTAQAHAQFTDSTQYYIRYALTGIFNRTNDGQSFVITNALNFNIKKEKVTFNSSTAYVYGQSNDALVNSDFASSFNFDLLADQHKLYYWGLANFVSSYSLNINRQVQGGVGLGYTFFNTRTAQLIVSDGVIFEASSLEPEPGVKDNYETIRNSLRVKHRWVINNIITLEGSHFWQPSFQDPKDYIIRSSTALSFKLKRWLNLSTALTYNRISRTDRENLLFNFGLVAETYFGRKRPSPPKP